MNIVQPNARPAKIALRRNGEHPQNPDVAILDVYGCSLGTVKAAMKTNLKPEKVPGMLHVEVANDFCVKVEKGHLHDFYDDDILDAVVKEMKIRMMDVLGETATIEIDVDPPAESMVV